LLCAAYLLWLYQRVFFGELSNPANEKLKDLSAREQWTLIPLIACAVWIGVYPQPFFDVMEKPVDKIVAAIATASAPAPTDAVARRRAR
jgi:NADH-quinone oxidoreductase subunit M